MRRVRLSVSVSKLRVGWEEGNNAGKIRYFQDYSAQDSSKHNHLDNHQHGKVNAGNFTEIPAASVAYE